MDLHILCSENLFITENTELVSSIHSPILSQTYFQSAQSMRLARVLVPVHGCATKKNDVDAYEV